MGCNCPKLVHLRGTNQILAERAARVKGGAARTPHLLTVTHITAMMLSSAQTTPTGRRGPRIYRPTRPRTSRLFHVGAWHRLFNGGAVREGESPAGFL